MRTSLVPLSICLWEFFSCGVSKTLRCRADLYKVVRDSQSRGVKGAAPYNVARSFRRDFLKSIRLFAKHITYFFMKVLLALFFQEKSNKYYSSSKTELPQRRIISASRSLSSLYATSIAFFLPELVIRTRLPSSAVERRSRSRI